MRDDVQAREQVHGPQDVADGRALLEGHLMLPFVTNEPNQHEALLLHHAYDRDARASL